MKRIFTASIDHGLRNPPVRWVMLAAPFGAGVGIYTFYALQPFLLDLYGDEKAYGIAGLAAAIVAGSQIVGGYLAPKIRSPVPAPHDGADPRHGGERDAADDPGR